MDGFTERIDNKGDPGHWSSHHCDGFGTAASAVLLTARDFDPGLDASILPGYDFISDANAARDGNVRDDNPADEGDWNSTSGCSTSNSSWHGTHAAGTVAAVTTTTGVAGTAFNAKVVPVRVLGRCGGSLSDIADAIIWASGGSVSGVPANANVAEVINMSLGGGSCLSSYQKLPERYQQRGVAWHQRGGGLHQCGQRVRFVAGQLRQRDRGGGHHLGWCQGQLFQLRRRNRCFRTGFGHSVHPQQRHHHTGHSQLRLVERHLDGGAACGWRGGADAVGGLESADAGHGERPAQGQCTAIAGGLHAGGGAGLVNADGAVAAVIASTTLTRNVARTRPSAALSDSLYYQVNVPAGTRSLKVTLAVGSGNADLSVRAGALPTDAAYSCRSMLPGNGDSCTLAAPAAGVYYVRLKATLGFFRR